MHCPCCGHEPPAGSPFCNGCGAKLVLTCASCGATPPPGSRFCNGCGATLGAAPVPTSAVPLERAPRDYTPKHLADKILTSRSALEGERKQVTVLFADVKGSMELAEQLDPEQWHRILERFFEILTEGVHRFEGTVNQYTGDGIMALFGAPIAHEDHARRACFAALHLRSELRGLQDELRLARGIDLQVRIGLHSGDVVVGKIGDDLRMDYTAQGHTVGLAQRMEQIAAPNTAVLSGATAALVEGFFELRSLGSSTLKGAREPVPVFELERLGAARTRLDVARARGFAKFVGRSDELAELEAAFARAELGQGQLLGIVAEAGAGKSRLCQEFADRCRARGSVVRSAHGVSHGKAVPLVPILAFYRQALGLEERDEPALARQKVAGALAQLDPALLDALPLLCEFLGVSDPLAKPAGVAGPERERRLLALLKRVTLARSARQTAVLILEDLHWFDPASERILSSIAETVDGSRTLLVVNFRPEYTAEWMGRSYYRQLALAPLGPEAVAELLANLLGRDASLEGLAERIRAHTGGNPYFVEEVVRALADSGALVGSAGHYRLTHPIAALQIPASVQALLASRIDRLPEREKRVLQAAAVIGREFAEPTLRRIAELAEDELADALCALVQAEFLYETALYPELEYAFKHPLTRDVAYDAQLRERRAGIHRALAHALIELHGEIAGERAPLIADHLERAGEARNAARWHARAAEWARRRSSAAAAVHWGRVRELLRGATDGDDLELATRAAAQLVRELARGDISQAEFDAASEDALSLARQAGDSLSEGIVYVGRFLRAFVVTGAAPEAHSQLAAAAERVTDREFRIAAIALVQGSPSVFGDPLSSRLRKVDSALALAGDDLSIGGDMLGYSVVPNLHAARAGCLAGLGRFGEAEAALDRARRIARELDEPGGATTMHLRAAIIALMAEDGAQAVEASRRWLEAISRVDWTATHRRFGPMLLLVGSCGHALEGDVELARAGIEEARGPSVEESPFYHQALALTSLASGETSLAVTHAGEWVRQGVPISQDGEARIFRARAWIRAEGKARVADALRDLETAQAVFDRVEIRAYAGRLEEARAEIAAAVGDETARLQHLREAERLDRAMGLDKRADALARQLRSLAPR